VLGAALWFTALQAFALHRFCPWCMTAHACGALAAILLLTRVPVTDATERRDKDPAVSRSTAVKFAVGAIVAVALLGVAQTLVTPKTYSVTTIPAVPTNSVAQTAPVIGTTKTNAIATLTNQVVPPVTTIGTNLQTNVAAALPPASAKTLDVLGGRFRLDLTQVPVWGSPDAPLKLLSLYDYTCHHCRDMHPLVLEVQRSFGDRLAIVSLPVPLDSQCNPLIRRTPPPHVNACVYAKLGLIVWRARHAAIQPFDDWLFSFQNPPPLNEVTNKVLQLVGLVPFEAASHDPWVEQQLRTDIDIYTVSGREFHQGNMPQFMIGTNIVTGILTVEQLRAVVARYVDAAK
jgi:protein-disulfide isomerase